MFGSAWTERTLCSRTLSQVFGNGDSGTACGVGDDDGGGGGGNMERRIWRTEGGEWNDYGL